MLVGYSVKRLSTACETICSKSEYFTAKSLQAFSSGAYTSIQTPSSASTKRLIFVVKKPLCNNCSKNCCSRLMKCFLGLLYFIVLFRFVVF